MFRFEDPAYLYLLAAVPVLALIRFVLARRQRRRLPTTLEQSLTMWEADMINGA